MNELDIKATFLKRLPFKRRTFDGNNVSLLFLYLNFEPSDAKLDAIARSRCNRPRQVGTSRAFACNICIVMKYHFRTSLLSGISFWFGIRFNNIYQFELSNRIVPERWFDYMLEVTNSNTSFLLITSSCNPHFPL